MKIKQLLQIQKIVEGRAIPYDILEGIEKTKYYSKSKGYHIDIGDMHLIHLLRVFFNVFHQEEPIIEDIEKLLSSDDFQEKIKLQILKEFGEKKDKQN